EKLCDAIGLGFSPNMLKWPMGGHPDDGIWAPHWYGAVWRSETFAGTEGPLPEIPSDLQPVLDAALPFYEAMKSAAL
ncbi:MAG: sulfotransferase-like domain-containing protein, partial [Cognatishimia sp.]|uniref:sulfotransferase-like domain-containing protein n=1 Tax=Cognatishimia sp. TaxID=2211648 RepID=UPI0040599E1E